MRPAIERFLKLAPLFFIFAFPMFAQSRSAPISDSELMALIAGNALPDNIIQSLKARGLDFQPNDKYLSVAKSAGANAILIGAIQKANFKGAADKIDAGTLSFAVSQLGAAGKLLREKDFDGATMQLTEGLRSGKRAELGFVMGEVLRQEENWEQAAGIFAQVLEDEPDFPEVHTKVSFVLIRGGDPEDGLREAKAALTLTPENAEAHKDAGLALETLLKFEASELEYKAALRIKPNYDVALYDMGNLFTDQHMWDRSIENYKKAILLNSTEYTYHVNLGNAYKTSGDLDSSIREFREAKRLNPQDPGVRQNLGNALMKRGLTGDAVAEFRELEKMVPEDSLCHTCMGSALLSAGDLQGAEQEYRTAIQLDPTDAGPHRGIANIREAQKKYDEALQEYRAAEQLDQSFEPSHLGAGRVLLTKKDFSEAIAELKQAETLDPTDETAHELLGQALLSAGSASEAISEFKQAAALDPKSSQLKMELASVLEKNGNMAEALDQYRQAAAIDTSREVQNQYDAAQSRLAARITSLKSSGNSAQAKKLESDIQTMQANQSISEKLNAAMQAGLKAGSERKFDESESHYKQAAELAEKMQPHDGRLVTSLVQLADLYAWNRDFPNAEATYQRAIKAGEEQYGPQSPMMEEPLTALGNYEVRKQDFTAALELFSRVVDLDEKTFGEGSEKFADSLKYPAIVYFAQKDYAKAEPFVLRSVHIEEALMGKDGAGLVAPLSFLCQLYTEWNKPDKLETCEHQLLAVAEKQYGTDSPVLIGILKSEAGALRQLGRSSDAALVEKRLQSIQVSTAQPLDPNESISGPRQ